MSSLRIGLIGLDTSHVEAYAGILNDASHPSHIPGARIVSAFPGGSPDFPLSISRVDGYTRKLRDQYGVTMLPNPRSVAETVDAVLITSADGRVHRAQFEEIAPTCRPVFIDKPFATTSTDARAIAETASRHGVRVFSSSNLRFSSSLQAAIAERSAGPIVRAEAFGPLRFEPTQPGYFWYGIHTAEMLYAALGMGCVSVSARREADVEIVTGEWKNGRTGVFQGAATAAAFSGVLHGVRRNSIIDVQAGREPIVGLAAAMVGFFRGAEAPVCLAETVEIIRFLEAANESRDGSGARVPL